MNLRFLDTVVAISQQKTLVEAAKSVNLSHSAVSLQVSSLEDELQIRILDRSRRPPELTEQGWALVEHAKRLRLIVDDILSLSERSDLHGKISIGAVPSTITHLVVPALAAMRSEHPALDVELHTDLSNRLIQRVLDRDVIAGLVTEPEDAIDELSIIPICGEPYQLVAPVCATSDSQAELLGSWPFLWFDQRSLLSRQVAYYLRENRIRVNPGMEATSIEAVEALVAHNLGVSILPRRKNNPPMDGVVYLPLQGPSLERQVALITRKSSPRQDVTKELAKALKNVSAKKPIPK
ncbi:LysR family transcriptional regulator [Rhodophyticola sp. CCM32]|uniref:LysR family transcriptional regulator n=1 Tax=Rhodophyticola sp. CCM32 TaxID=2916397 RepID=UPI00107FCE58|nr:LysR family transcriptional regulator [Rhodophyticola sp. CCM32]QBY00772.1 LysR family transcriptional regulator [Rhodophyticola sp. CCM32]